MRRIAFYVSIVIIVVIFNSCRKPLDIKTTTSNSNILVVEGLINIGADSTKIKLSRTVIIGNKTTANPEGNAIVTIENAQATVATLKEITKGTYASPGLNLDKTKQYRVRIKTSTNKTYLSDLTEAKVTPPIDSVGYTINNSGMLIYANTHDATNNSRYYLYTFTEAWKFHSDYFSGYITNGTALIGRTPGQIVYYCFSSDASTTIVLNSTAALAQDIAYQAPITSIDFSSEKLQMRYSIMVTQTALTKEAYAFWDNLKKNTENLGSIFDAQPSEISGNIHNTADASEPVIGYISAATTQSKRIFIDNTGLPSKFVAKSPFTCMIDTAKIKDGGVQNNLIPIYTTLYTLAPFGLSSIEGYTYSNKSCSDCTIRGTLKQPSFWKN